jgi:iron complex outermembrane recepter protein
MIEKKSCFASSGHRVVPAGVLAACLGATLASDPAHAQSASDAAVDEIVVTARRYQEYLQDVPLSVTVFSDEQLREAGINSAADLQYYTPSLVISDQNNSRSIATYAVRGLSNGGDEITETSVTPYFSEVPTLAPKGSSTLYDMGSVQVLKGPQGTLFGRTATAGAVLFTPAHPELGTSGGRLDLTAGDLGRRELTGIINVPLTGETLAARFAVHHDHLDGYTERLDGGRAFDERKVLSGRASLEWRPNEAFSNYTVVQYDRFSGTSAGQVLSAYNSNPNGFGFFPGFDIFAALGVDADFQAELDRLRDGGDDAVRRTAGSPNNPVSEEGDSLLLVDIAQLSFDVGDSLVSVKNILGYQRAGLIGGRDLDGTAIRWNDNVTGLIGDGAGAGSGTINTDPGAQSIGGGNIRKGPRVELYTEELQFSGGVRNDLLRWVAGGYYQGQPAAENTKGTFNAFYILNGLAADAYLANPSVVTGGYGWESGFYGQGTLNLSEWTIDGLHFTAAYRRSRSSQRSTQQAALGFDPVTGQLLLDTATDESSIDSEGNGWTLALDYKATDNVLLYGTTRAGYQPGGINSQCDGIGCPTTFGNEKVRDVEVGVKTDFDLFGRRARLNIAAYRMKYEDIQRSFGAIDAALNPVVFTDNVAEARLEGVEIDGFFQPAKGLMVSGFYSYNDAAYTDYIGEDPLVEAQPGDPVCVASSPPGVCNLDLSNQPFPGNARNKAGLTVRYELPFVAEGNGKVSLAANVFYQDRQYFGEGARRVIDYLSGFGDPRYTPEYVRDHVVSQPSYALLNLRADWKNILGSNATVSLFVRNVTDEVYATGAIPTFITFLGIATRSYGEPRTVGAQVSYQFGALR